MADVVSRIYSNFRGVDFRGDEINLIRSPDSLNMWKDYRYTDSIRTRPTLKQVTSGYSTFYGIFFYNDEMIYHTGDSLYKRKKDGTTDIIYYGVNQAPSNAFVYEGIFYFMDGVHYFQYDGTEVKDVVGYIPTTSIARKPGHGGGGKIHEDVNFLSPYRKNTFLSDNVEIDYYLDSMSIDEVTKVEVLDTDTLEFEEKVLGTDYTVDCAKGIVKFKKAPPKPLTDGQDNVRVTFKKTIDGYANTILNCTMVQVFDNRVFVSGNPKYPNVVYHCSLNDPTYFSDLDFYREGMDDSPVRGMVAGNNALWVFREPSDANTNVFYHNPTIDDDYGKIYPSSHSSITTGCIGRAINFNDDIVFFSERGMEGISGDITTEQVVAHRSTLVDRKMIAEADYKNMILAEWEGYLLVFIGNKVYLADSRTAFTNEDHIEYEWFYWELDFHGKEAFVTSVAVHDGVLYIGASTESNHSVFAFEYGYYDVESYWVTPKDKFNAPHRLKTTNKRGCVAEATGDISVYAKLEDTDYELIGTYENVTDYFVSRIKRKKFKDIQLKFYSKTGFSLETVTLESFIGGYIKR